MYAWRRNKAEEMDQENANVMQDVQLQGRSTCNESESESESEIEDIVR